VRLPVVSQTIGGALSKLVASEHGLDGFIGSETGSGGVRASLKGQRDCG
jgi:hypothetical protein